MKRNVFSKIFAILIAVTLLFPWGVKPVNAVEGDGSKDYGFSEYAPGEEEAKENLSKKEADLEAAKEEKQQAYDDAEEALNNKKEKASDAYEDAQNKTKEAEEDLSNKEQALEDAKDEKAAADKEASDKEEALKAAQKDADAKKAAAEAAEEKKAKGSLGFFEGRNENAANIIKERIANQDGDDWGNTELGKEGDATSLDNMKKTFDFIREGNSLRASDEYNSGMNKEPLKVNDVLMAIAQIQANASAGKVGHSQLKSVGENLAWGHSDPFDGWYDEEKQNWIVKNGEPTGHYLNITNSENEASREYSITGFAIVDKEGTKYGIAHGQTFGGQSWYEGSDEPSYSVDDYEKAFDEYRDQIEKDIKAYKDAQEAVKKAQEEKDAADKKAKEAKEALDKAQKEKNAAEKALEEAKDAEEEAKKEKEALEDITLEQVLSATSSDDELNEYGKKYMAACDKIEEAEKAVEEAQKAYDAIVVTDFVVTLNQKNYKLGETFENADVTITITHKDGSKEVVKVDNNPNYFKDTAIPTSADSPAIINTDDGTKQKNQVFSMMGKDVTLPVTLDVPEEEIILPTTCPAATPPGTMEDQPAAANTPAKTVDGKKPVVDTADNTNALMWIYGMYISMFIATSALLVRKKYN